MPLDNTKKNLGWSLTPVDFDPTLGGAFPTVTTLTPGKGEIQELSSNLYDYQWVAYGIVRDKRRPRNHLHPSVERYFRIS
jgi:hypothetical protein